MGHMGHYDYLDRHLSAFFAAVGLDPRAAPGLDLLHGDKCYGYQAKWEKAGVPFAHGVCIYMLSHFRPFSKESRETDDGWVPVDDWVMDNYDKFKEFLPE